MSKLLDAILTNNTKQLVYEATGFRYQPTRKRLVMSNNALDLECLNAWSYGHWCYVSKIEGLVVFNAYKYSNTTNRHQYRMRELLYKLGIRIDVEISTRRSLTQVGDVSELQRGLRNEIQCLREQLATCVRKTSGKRDRIQFKIEEVQEYLNKLAQHQADKQAGEVA